MKKILFLMCSALLIGFSSCSSDDDDDSFQFPSKKLSKIEEYDDNGDLVYIETFSYDNQGRWIKSELDLKRWDGNIKPELSVRTLSYSGDKINYFESGYESYVEIFTVKNNRITSRYKEGSDDNVYNYQYSNSYLTKIGEDYADFQYTNGNLTKVTEDEGDTEYNITYTDSPDKLGLNIFETSYNDGDLDVRPDNPLYQLGYLGKKSNNLIKSIKCDYYNGNTDTFNFSYTFDNDGFVSEMIKRGGYPRFLKYKFYYQ